MKFRKLVKGLTLKRLKALVDDFADRIDHKRCSTDSSRNFANLVSAN